MKKTDFLIQYIYELKGFLYGIILFLNIPANTLEILYYLMITDTILGVWKSVVLQQKFSFKLLLFGINTKLIILSIPLILGLIIKGLTKDFDGKEFLIKVTQILIVSESISIFSSLYTIKTKKELENFDPLSLLLKLIRTQFINIFNNFIKIK